MSKWGRVKSFLSGVLGILCSLLLLLNPETGYTTITIIICILFLVKGIQQIVYYCSMGIHMVGGKTILYKGIIVLDLGIITLGVSTMPRKYVMIYLIFSYFFYSAVEILQVLESRRLGAPSWRTKLLSGAASFCIAVVCIFHLESTLLVMILLCSGFISTGIQRIAAAFRRTAIVYIQ